MAEFLTAYSITNKNEGGYNNDPQDAGKETYAGISRRYWPNWPGWKIVDNYKPLKREQIIKNDQLKALVKQFYYDNFWKAAKADFIQNQQVANQVYDFMVNSGRAAEQINIALALPAVNKISSDTITKINTGKAIEVNNKIADQRVKYLIEQNKAGNIADKFIKGLIDRAKRYILDNKTAVSFVGTGILITLFF